MLEGLRHLVSLDRPPLEILRDLLDILVVTFIVYRALLVMKGTRAMQMGIGFVAFGFLYLIAKYAQLATLMSVLSWLASSAILILVVVFQNDIRRALIRLGSKAWLTRGRDAQERVIEEVVAAATELARHRMGAIICLERDANVLEFVKNDGVELDSEVTRELLVSLFIPEAVNKTHDGAVLIRDLRMARAGIFFPMPESTKVSDSSFGSRHRAAIGITEETDAVVIVVSEERGSITLFFNANTVRNLNGPSLRNALKGLFRGEDTAGRSPFRLRRPEEEVEASKPVSEPRRTETVRDGPADKRPPKPAAPSKTPATAKPEAEGKAAKPEAKPAKAEDKPAKPEAKPAKTAKPAKAAKAEAKPAKPEAPTEAAKAEGKPKDKREAKESEPPPPGEEGARETPQVRMPMPASKDPRHMVEEGPSEEAAAASPGPASVSKPMAPTDLPRASVPGDDK